MGMWLEELGAMKNKKQMYIYALHIGSGRCGVGARLRRSAKSSSTARGLYLDGRPLTYALTCTSTIERKASFSETLALHTGESEK